ncbi:MAG: transglutaminase-like cysteine peptidase [Motiliproteus sp.]
MALFRCKTQPGNQCSGCLTDRFGRRLRRVKTLPLLLSMLALLASWFAFALEELEWQALFAKVESHYGERAGKRVRAWHQLQLQGPAATELETLEKVNRFFNRLHWIDDEKLWSETDYWATPIEFLGANGGDCEDFSIAKYLTLTALGIDDDKLRIAYVKSLTYNQFHMVVTYYPSPTSVPLVLDNIDGEIKPADQRMDLTPIYSFNGRNLWLNKARDQGVLAGGSNRLKRWNDLRSRYRVQKLRQPTLNLE